MGSNHARFYLYPDPTGTLETYDLGETISDLQEDFRIERVDARNGAGSRFSTLTGSSWRVRVIWERFGSVGAQAAERALTLVENHLRAGGYVGFAGNHSKAWAGFVTTGRYAVRGDTTIYTDGNAFGGWSPSASLASGDEVSIDTLSPFPLYREIRTVDTLSSGKIVGLGEPLARSVNPTAAHGGAVALIRHRDFYPLLKLPADDDRPLVTHDKRITYTFDAILECAFADLASYVASMGNEAPRILPLAGTGGVSGLREDERPSLDTLIRGSLAARAGGGSIGTFAAGRFGLGR